MIYNFYSQLKSENISCLIVDTEIYLSTNLLERMAGI